jgi:hypothetical protein
MFAWYFPSANPDKESFHITKLIVNATVILLNSEKLFFMDRPSGLNTAANKRFV